MDVVGSAAIPTLGGKAGKTGVSVEINVSYLDAAYVDVPLSLSLYIYSIGVYFFL